MSEEDLWGNIEEVKLPTNPKMILKEQADAIGRKTKYVLKGTVVSGSTKGAGGKPLFNSGLVVEARRLENYTYDLLLIKYPLEMYPVELNSFPDSKIYTCNTEGEFVEKLGSILSSEKVMKTIAALVSQSRT